MKADAVHACFLPPGEQLYACRHDPRPGAAGRRGVVLVPPFGHEYLRCHRALTQLAQRLARAGLPCLRFDPRGTGNSSGDGLPESLELWLDDIDAAREALMAESGVEEVVLGGVRFGASLCLEHGARRGQAPAMILWEPIVQGAEGVASWRAAEEAFASSLPGGSRAAGGFQCVGFALPDELIRQVEALDFTALKRRPAREVVVLARDGEAFSAQLESLRTPVTYQRYEGAAFWSEDVDKGLVPAAALDELVRTVAELST